jgi:hypothetical protein
MYNQVYGQLPVHPFKYALCSGLEREALCTPLYAVYGVTYTTIHTNCGRFLPVIRYKVCLRKHYDSCVCI